MCAHVGRVNISAVVNLFSLLRGAVGMATQPKTGKMESPENRIQSSVRKREDTWTELAEVKTSKMSNGN